MVKSSVRVGGIAGIFFVVLVAVPGFATSQPPDATDPASKFLAYYQDHRSALIASAFLGTAGIFFAAFYLGGLMVAFRRLGGAPALIVAAITGLIITGSVATAGALFTTTAAYRVNGAQHVDAETVRALADASAISFTLIGLPIAAFFAACGLIMVKARFFPAWLAAVAGIAAAAEVVGSAGVFATSGAFAPGGVLGLILGLLPFTLFVLATSIIMITRGDDMERSTA